VITLLAGFASDVDGWMRKTYGILQTALGAVEKFVNNARIRATVFGAFLANSAYRDQQKMLSTGAAKKKLTRLADCMRIGRQFLYLPSSQVHWINY
jgi:hypothetical protein